MPPGGWLGSLPLEGILRPKLAELGEAPEPEPPPPPLQASLFAEEEKNAEYKNHPLVRNVKDDPRGYDVDCMRPGKWGNPFVVGKDGSRAECIAMHKEWLPTQPLLIADLHELKGKRLGCCCHPEPCHCDTLARMAEKVSFPAAPNVSYPDPVRPHPPAPVLEACDMADDLTDELLGPDIVSLQHARSSFAAARTEPSFGRREDTEVEKTAEVVVTSSPTIPQVCLRNKGAFKQLKEKLGSGFGGLSVSFVCFGKIYTLDKCQSVNIPPEFLESTHV
jgi:hypothetical protein